MKIAFVNFTYSKDVELVKQMIRGIDRLWRLYPEHEITLSIYDDSNNPAGNIFDTKVSGFYTATTFNRNGNLNGLEAIYGILDSYKDTKTRTGCDWVVKVDSDTYVSNLEWLLSSDHEKTSAVYSAFHNPVTPIGSCYAISAKFIDAIIETVHREDIVARIKKGTGPEDMCIMAAARSGGNWVHPHGEKATLCYIVGTPQEGAMPLPEELAREAAKTPEDRYNGFLKRTAVAFKKYFLEPEVDEYARINAIRTMREFADYAEDKPTPEKS